MKSSKLELKCANSNIKGNIFNLKVVKYFFLIVSFFIFHVSLLNCSSSNQSLINFTHLEQLSEIIEFQGDSVGIVHIYSEYPEYKWVDANKEGIACVDDVARAAVLRLHHYEWTKDEGSLQWARYYLKFVVKMQTNDGEFFNFIDKSYEINRSGNTSFKSFGWWAVRGYWALAEGYRILQNKDRIFAQQLKQHFLRCKNPIRNLLKNYHKTEKVNERFYPKWLVNLYAADATAVLLQAIVSYLQSDEDAELKDYACQLAEGIVSMQCDRESKFPGAFLSFPDLWHAWGNSQSVSMSLLTPQLKNNLWLNSARKEVQQFYPRLILKDWLHEFRLSREDEMQFPQIAYGIRCAALAALKNYQVTGEQRQARLAGLLASWLFGNNPAKKAMYDSRTGRCYDGIVNENEINLNAGAESTIEALLTLIEIEQEPLAKPFLQAKLIQATKNIQLSNFGFCQFRIYGLKDRRRYVLVYSWKSRTFYLMSEIKWQHFIETN